MDFSILWVENEQLLCRCSLSLFQALGSLERARKKRGETVSVVGASEKRERARKKGGTLSVVGGERKNRASEEEKGAREEKMGETLGSWDERKNRASEEEKGGESR